MQTPFGLILLIKCVIHAMLHAPLVQIQVMIVVHAHQVIFYLEHPAKILAQLDIIRIHFFEYANYVILAAKHVIIQAQGQANVKYAKFHLNILDIH